jgi:hypothetical protein
MRIPKDLQAAAGKKELRYSLQEGFLRKPKNKAKMVSGQDALLRLGIAEKP